MSKKQTKEVRKVELTHHKLLTELHPAIVSLGSQEIKSIKCLMSVAKMRKITDESVKNYNDLRQKIAERNCEKDKAGKPIIEDNNYVYKDDKVKSETFKLIAELLNAEITLELPILQEEWLDEVGGLTGNVISALLDVIE